MADAFPPPVTQGLARAPSSRRLPSGGWTFGGGLASHFDDHVRRSIPDYEALHGTCLELIGARLRPGDVAYDLGCSTGAFTARLQAAHPEARIVGVDSEPEMIAEAVRQRDARTAAQNALERPRGNGPEYLASPVESVTFQPARAFALLYVLQFLPYSSRPGLLTRIRASLTRGGALVVAEKVRFEAPSTQAEADLAYRAFKRSQGFSEAEIEAKARSLSGVLVPLTETQNVKLLRESGFGQVRLVQQSLCFRAWLAEL